MSLVYVFLFHLDVLSDYCTRHIPKESDLRLPTQIKIQFMLVIMSGYNILPINRDA